MKPEQIDFEFQDQIGKRFRCFTWGDEPWLFRWNNGNWVSLRKLSDSEVEIYRAIKEGRAFSFEQAFGNDCPSGRCEM